MESRLTYLRDFEKPNSEARGRLFKLSLASLPWLFTNCGCTPSNVERGARGPSEAGVPTHHVARNTTADAAIRWIVELPGSMKA